MPPALRLRPVALALLALLLPACAVQPGGMQTAGLQTGLPQAGSPQRPGQITVSLSGTQGVPRGGTQQPGQITVSLSGVQPGLPPATGGGVQDVANRHPADIPGPVCSAQHRPLIEEAVAVARSRTEDAARFILAQPGHPHVTRWFGDAPRGDIARRLQQTAALLAQPDTVKMLCNDPPACTGSRMAYAAVGRAIMGVCPAFFRARMDGYDTRWGILVHEASHLAAGTNDHAYGPAAAMQLAQSDPRRAAENADNLEYFVETLPR